MKHLFVPYELSVKLKEKEFNEQCLMVYESKDSMIPESEAGNNKNNVDAPLYQQVIDWLFEKHELQIIELPCTWTSKERFYSVYKCKVLLQSTPSTLDKAIEHALKLLIK